MTTNQTIEGVSRELLVRLLTHITDGVPFRVTDLGELRALLDAPIESQYDGMTPEQAQAVSDGVDGILFGKPICERADFEEWCASEDMDPKSQSGFLMWESWKARAQKPAAQPQGEPVADLIRLDRSYRNGLMAGFQFGITGDENGYAACIQRYNAGIKEAKAEQPAPVAVVLPDSVKVLHRFEGDPISQAQAQGWNACLYEVARLNAAQPVPVAAALPVDPERERLMEIVQQYPNVDPLKYDAAVRTLRK